MRERKQERKRECCAAKERNGVSARARGRESKEGRGSGTEGESKSENVSARRLRGNEKAR